MSKPFFSVIVPAHNAAHRIRHGLTSITRQTFTNYELIVVCDDIDLPVGRIRIRRGGSAGGHNGLKNIIAMLGTDQFVRVRVGVGQKPAGWDLADYVLGHFDAQDRVIMDEAVKRAADAVEMILSDGVDAAMNQFNRR